MMTTSTSLPRNVGLPIGPENRLRYPSVEQAKLMRVADEDELMARADKTLKKGRRPRSRSTR